MLVTPSTVAHSVISAQTPCCVCHKISKTVLIQKLFLSSAPSLLPLRPSLPPHPPSGPCWSWHKDANLSGCISLGTTVTAGSLAALSDSILPAISHTHTHTQFTFTACRQTGVIMWVPGVAEPTGGESWRKKWRRRNGVWWKGGGAWMGDWAYRQPDAAN